MIDKNKEFARVLARKVHESGGRAYFVGGYVRDKILGVENKDIDIEVHGIPYDRLEHILEDFGEVMKIGKSFGVLNVKGYDLDIAMPRRESATGYGHRDFEIYVDPDIGLYSAARRRDFTVNALMEDILTGEVIDNFGGLDDIKNKCIRHVCTESFAEDPLRVLRAAQFAARFEYTLADETLELCKTIDISTLSFERIDGEMRKALLKARKPSIFFDVLLDTGHLQTHFREIFDLRGVPQTPIYHAEGDVWAHTMLVLDTAAEYREEAKEKYPFMLSALCHDFGKVVCTCEKEGKIISHEHEVLGLSLVEHFISGITGDKSIKKYVLNMTKLHMRPNSLAVQNSSVKSSNKLFDESVCPDDLILLSKCDALSSRRADGASEYTHEAFLRERLDIYREYMSRPYITGQDLIAAGLKPGEDFSEKLAFAHKLRLAGVDKKTALKMVLGGK